MLGVVSIKLGNAYTNYWAVNGKCRKKKKKERAPNATLASLWKKLKGTVI